MRTLHVLSFSTHVKVATFLERELLALPSSLKLNSVNGNFHSYLHVKCVYDVSAGSTALSWLNLGADFVREFLRVARHGYFNRTSSCFSTVVCNAPSKTVAL